MIVDDPRDPHRFERRWRGSEAGVRSDADGRVTFSQLQQTDDDDEGNDR